MASQTVLILDFGGQYKELIARRVRECAVYSVVRSGDISAAEIRAIAPIGIILTGGPNSVYDPASPHCDSEIFNLGIPVLGICYGAQLMAWTLGGKVTTCATSEYGKTKMHVDTSSFLFVGLDEEQLGLMSHTDQIDELPEGFVSIAHTETCPNAAMANYKKRLYAFQFHPEVESTPRGTDMIRAFLYEACGAVGDYNLKNLELELIEKVRAQVGDAHVILGLSGGVDSSVCAALLSKAIPGQLHCIFVDHGLMRKNEGDEVEAAFAGRDLHFIRVNAQQRFLSALAGVSDPEQKRKIIGREFINVFADCARKYKNCKFLGQGTIYPDVIESSHALKGPSQTIKSHHNVGGLPPDLKFELVEPLRDLFKDEVRAVGRVLGMDSELLDRQPFPGPGLGVRILGEVTEEKVKLLQQADLRVQEEVKKLPDYKTIWQTFAVLLPVKSVGVMGDQRTYEYTCAIRSVNSIDAMTADWTRLPYETLATMSNRIINEVRGINRVVYDISSKPPATIEWE